MTVRNSFAIPPNLLGAIASCSGRVTLILGAGCSIEAPTSLKLSKDYSLQIHRQLVADGELSEGDCSTPEDLSLLASTVHRLRGRQAPVVHRLPISAFKLARANDGYLAVAALLCEGAIGLVASLNFDLAMTDALRQLSAEDVEEIASPHDLGRLGAKALVYLHRNANETDPEAWVLRKEVLDDEWRVGWERVIADRLAASPVVLFAGLGSPAAALTETLSRVRSAVPAGSEPFLADPSENSEFAEALDLPEGNHIRAYWGEFMTTLAQRVVIRSTEALGAACEDLCRANGWVLSRDGLDRQLGSLTALGLVGLGRVRARWLGGERAYLPDEAQHRLLVADLVLALGLISEVLNADFEFDDKSGLVRVHRAGLQPIVVMPISARGVMRWSHIEGIIPKFGHARPDLVLAGGVPGPRVAASTPPSDIVIGEVDDDLVLGPSTLFLSIDDLRADPAAALRQVA